MEKRKIIALEGYHKILQDVREILHSGIQGAHKAVDLVRIRTYWKVGERMVRGELENKGRADYGAQLVFSMAMDLGMSRYELSRMMNFYRNYPIVADIPQQLSWSHIRELLPLEGEKRRFYESEATDQKWNHVELRHAIQKRCYEEFKKTRRTLPVKKLPALPLSEEIFKESYRFDFFDLNQTFSEHDLEDAILDRVIRVLTELGKNFSLVGRQVKILIDGNWDKIDLVFYHTRLHSYILTEIKKGKFRKEFVGQLNAYIEYYRNNEESEGDNPTIGLVLCEDIGYEEAVYALGGLEKKIFIAKYRINLPTEKAITAKLKELHG